MKAIWNNRVIAESEETLILDGYHYFPTGSVLKEYLVDSQTHTGCYWKGTASYYNVVVGKEENKDAAWYYADPSDAAEKIKDHIAFWRGVEIVD